MSRVNLSDIPSSKKAKVAGEYTRVAVGSIFHAEETITGYSFLVVKIHDFGRYASQSVSYKYSTDD
jgi:hypothetical protein